ncbi:ABC transporter ATP-binding protein [Azospirillum doebereinerae]|uniref:ABC transporter ATP-binding protein n=1 Tax=Azospirillum doebereinerae TaxID=92933 RepID=A0A433J0I4_9PROT|nr:ABC transporter ATP-binding protein [Azospirillum doebereinerae]MCG5243529.1 ABC transporter ATP-binding protein [Azospirillum doebereinerae]RUQ62524.1 ABC transporter ATP-binding protein [Azospirillum doebereinerae]
MATIHFDNLGHSYHPHPSKPTDYALRRLSQEWEDGKAYALLGPSGCGKSTLLNIISGLLVPSEGRVLFDGLDVTRCTPEERNIAQVFQFPVIYDTMTVYENLAFPLRNRKVPEADVDRRVRQVAEALDLTADLKKRAQRLTPDAKQKISMGRGLVRSDVAAILFDEPLTVIDPHTKWILRRKLRQIHEEYRLTMIYVTHDQVEALTFADKVAVMHEGAMVQLGTPQELFENPEHTFVGYFIGSPGINLMPCTLGGDHALVEGIAIPLADRAIPNVGGTFELGIRPEFVELTRTGTAGAIPVQVVGVDDLGTSKLATLRMGSHTLKARLSEDQEVPALDAAIRFPTRWTKLYRDSHLVS